MINVIESGMSSKVASTAQKAADGMGEAYRILQKQNAMNSEMKKLLPSSVKFINRMKDWQGEAFNICVNSLGTGLVAPVFIKYNFLSKTDEDTRTYSALRQPVSALLAIVTQAGITIPFDRLLTKMSNEGELTHDKNNSILKDKKYFANMMRKAHPELSKKDLKKLGEEEYYKNYSKFYDNLLEKDAIVYTHKGKQVVMPRENYQKLVVSTIEDKLNVINSNIKRYEDLKSGMQIERANYMRLQHGSVSKALGDIKTFADGLDTKSPESKNTLENFIKKYIKENDIKDKKQMHSILEETMYQPDINSMKARINKTVVNCKKFAQCETKEELETLVKAKVKAELKAELAERKAMEEVLKVAKSGKKSIKELAEMTKNTKGCNLVFDVVEKYKGNIEKRMKGCKQMSGLLVSLAVLPLSCWMLNKIYPVFMDTFFPSLSNAKKSKTDGVQKTEQVKEAK